ncbi:MAG: hypothetical protein JJ992_07410, partial [Planctomycetes bacterium]|nr:hypothetical protein [Planctomycetota bacterium]
FGRCLEGRTIDREIGDLRGETRTVIPDKLFTYVRYNAELSRQGFGELARDADGNPRIPAELANGLEAIDPVQVRRMDSVEHIEKLQIVGRAVGQALVRKEHFARFLDGNA